MLRLSLLSLLAFVSLISASKYPIIEIPETTDANGVEWIGPIRRCSLDFNDGELDDCTKKIQEDLTPKVGAGIPEIGLRPLDPYLLEKFDFQEVFGPVKVNIAARGVKMEGLAQYKTLNFKVDTKNQKMYIEYEVPKILINAFYKAGGSAVLFPVTGAGPAVVKINNLKTKGVMDYRIVTREDGKAVVQLDSCILKDMKITGMNIKISGLFRGNPLMSAMVHYFANTYGTEMFEILLKDEMSKLIGEIIAQDVLNPVLYNLPHLPAYLKD